MSTSSLRVKCGGSPHGGVGGWQWGLAQDHVCRLLRQHDGRSVEVPADDARHTRRVDDAQSVGADHATLWVDHGRLVRRPAHATRARRVVGGVGSGAHERVQFGVRLSGISGRQLRAAELVERLLREHLAREPHTRAELLPVPLRREVVGFDDGMPGGIAGSEGEPTDTGGPQRTDMRLVRVAVGHLLPVVEHDGREEVELDVGVGDARLAAHEGARLEVSGGGGAGAAQEPLGARPDHRQREAPLVPVEGDRLLAALLHVHLQVVLQVAPDARPVHHHRDVVPLQVVRVADARQQEELRRVDRAAAHDHLSFGEHPLGGATLPVLDADGGGPVEDDACGEDAAVDGEVVAAERRT